MKHSHFTSFISNHLRYGMVNPMRDWIIIIITFTVALTGIVVWNVRIFDAVVNGEPISSSATDSQPLFDRSSLEKVRSIFADRASEKIKYENGTYRFADPSQ